MNFILSSIIFFMVSSLPEGYHYKNQKIIMKTDISPQNCNDISLIRMNEKTPASEDYILSYCKNEKDERPYSYSVFSVRDRRPIPLDEFYRTFKSTGYGFFTTDKRLVVYGNKKDKVKNESQPFFWVIQNGNIYPMKKFLASFKNNHFIFAYNKSFYILQSEKKTVTREIPKARITRLNFPGKMPSSIGIESFQIPHGFPFLILKTYPNKERYGIYNLNKKKWILYPFENKCSHINIEQNYVYIDFTYPGQIKSSDKKVYFEIYIDGKRIKRTSYFIEGDDYGESIKLKKGKNIIELKKFTAEIIRGGEKKYVPAKNIEQMYPIAITNHQNSRYLISIDVSRNGEKPYTLKQTICK